jgi:glycosyltransferase involved in cell wall biosynthesis
VLRASVIFSFYNDLPILRLALDALATQYAGQFEVLIADDGSRPDIVRELEQLLPRYEFQVRHLWHADSGFRKTVILNRAVTQAQTDCLVFVDADCVPQRHFVDDHLRHAGPGICQTGRRIDVFRDAKDELDCSEPAQMFSRNWTKLLRWSWNRQARNIEKGIRLPAALADKLRGRAWGALGCNFSVNRQDFLQINGFDERFCVTWGAEDSDPERRLLKAGVRIRSLRYQATMIHFDGSYFKRRGGMPIRQANEHYAAVEAENRVWTPYGIVKEDRPDPQLYP